MEGPSPSLDEGEASRIRAAYARRQLDDRYSWFNAGHVFIVQQRERQLLDLLKRCGVASLGTKKVLEIGCGTGYWLRELIKWGARPENLVGIDLIAERIAEAKRLCPERVQLQRENATKLGFEDGTFDLELQSTAFTSILDSRTKQKVASEMLRVLKAEGFILWYDYHVSRPRNDDVRGVKKREIYNLFPGCDIKLCRVTLIPPLARALAPRSWFLCYLLEKIPLLCTHYLGIIRKR